MHFLLAMQESWEAAEQGWGWLSWQGDDQEKADYWRWKFLIMKEWLRAPKRFSGVKGCFRVASSGSWILTQVTRRVCDQALPPSSSLGHSSPSRTDSQLKSTQKSNPKTSLSPWWPLGAEHRPLLASGSNDSCWFALIWSQRPVCKEKVRFCLSVPQFLWGWIRHSAIFFLYKSTWRAREEFVAINDLAGQW